MLYIAQSARERVIHEDKRVFLRICEIKIASVDLPHEVH